jgi:tetratricopeptide (TPR) repeat protein
MMHHWNEVFPGEILEVQYEDVVEDTEGMARKMLEYIGVEWEPQVLAFNELDRPVKTASVWQVRQPIYKTSKAKWKRYEKHLGPLIKGTNAKITWEPFEMVRLPEPGMLQKGIKLYEQGDLDAAEYEFKKLLHHLPEHAAANHMVGIIYVRKGHLDDGIELMEKALKVCPWNQNWRKDLIQALEIAGQHDRVAELKKNQPVAPKAEKPEQKDEFDWGNLTVPNSAPIY